MAKIRTAEYLSWFDEKSGAYFRTGILKNGRDTGEDPFMGVFPELLDVGITGHCAAGKMGSCRTLPPRVWR